MQKVVAAAFYLSVLLPLPATAKWFWESGIGCEPLDQSCLLDVALEDMEAMVEKTSVNSYGEALGKLWPYLDEATSRRLVETYHERREGDDLAPYVNIAVAETPPRAGAVQKLSDLLDDRSIAGYLPVDYLGMTLTDAALRENAAATADLAIVNGESFAEITIDGLYTVIAWMARNDLTKLEAYLKAHDPRQSVYFAPSTHLFRVAAEICNDGQDGKPLIDIALEDLLRTSITTTERHAVPMRAVLACDGLPAATAAIDDMLLGAGDDIERLTAKGQVGSFLARRVVKAVNDDGLAPVIRKLHEDGQTAEAEALASRLFPEALRAIVVGQDGVISIDESDVPPRLAQILAEDDAESVRLDPVTFLRWFTTSVDPDSKSKDTYHAVAAIDSILRLWPDPLAQEATKIALPLLASSEFRIADEIRLKTGIAIASAETCMLSEAASEAVLDRIASLKKPAPRVIGLADYLRYLASYDSALPVCEE